MKNIKWPKNRLTRIGSGATLLAAVAFGVVFFETNKSYASPGALSAAQAKSEPLGGYMSHAEFEKECGHCHAPIHCITDTRCQSCHIEIARQREEATGLHGRLPVVDKCQTCHIEHQGHDAVITTFAFANLDHEALADFSLVLHQQDYDGQEMNCESCHAQNIYTEETLDCTTCHSGADHDFMAEHIELYGLDCVSCHDGRDRFSDFDHNQVYALEGLHVETECLDCHPEQVFAGTPQDCLSCHEDPEVHVGLFGLECDRCHTAQAWVPAELTRHLFPLDHGGEGEIVCETCHENSYVELTCYGCHDHLLGEMIEIHAAEDIDEGVDVVEEKCIDCHPTGKLTGQEDLNGGDEKDG